MSLCCFIHYEKKLEIAKDLCCYETNQSINIIVSWLQQIKYILEYVMLFCSTLYYKKYQYKEDDNISRIALDCSCIKLY